MMQCQWHDAQHGESPAPGEMQIAVARGGPRDPQSRMRCVARLRLALRQRDSREGGMDVTACSGSRAQPTRTVDDVCTVRVHVNYFKTYLIVVTVHTFAWDYRWPLCTQIRSHRHPYPHAFASRPTSLTDRSHNSLASASSDASGFGLVSGQPPFTGHGLRCWL